MPIGSKQRLKVGAEPRAKRAFAEDGPVQHAAAVDLLEEACKFGGVAFDQFAPSPVCSPTASSRSLRVSLRIALNCARVKARNSGKYKICDERFYSYCVPGLVEMMFPDWF